MLKRFAAQVLQLLVRLGRQADSLDWVTICQCLMFLDNPDEVAKILHQLLTGSEVPPPDNPARTLRYASQQVLRR